MSLILFFFFLLFEGPNGQLLSFYELLFIHPRNVLKTDMWQRIYEEKKSTGEATLEFVNCVTDLNHTLSFETK